MGKNFLFNAHTFHRLFAKSLTALLELQKCLMRRQKLFSLILLGAFLSSVTLVYFHHHIHKKRVYINFLTGANNSIYNVVEISLPHSHWDCEALHNMASQSSFLLVLLLLFAFFYFEKKSFLLLNPYAFAFQFSTRSRAPPLLFINKKN